MEESSHTRTRTRLRGEAGESRAKGVQQDWILKCLQGVRAHPLAACAVATL